MMRCNSQFAIVRILCLNRWLILALLVGVTACSGEPTPRLPDFVPPTSIIATVVPIPTLLPTTTPGAELGAPTVQPTPTSSPTSSRAVRSTPNQATRYPAPGQIEPKAPALFKDGNDIKFKYAAVGKLEPNHCYLLHVELAVPNLPKGNRGDDFLDSQNCGDSGPAGKELSFVLYRGKFVTSPNYGTMLAQVSELMPEARLLKMTWTLRVVQNNGRAADGVHYNTIALSPNSPVSEFDFQP